LIIVKVTKNILFIFLFLIICLIFKKINKIIL
jgi:hypothetical protein